MNSLGGRSVNAPLSKVLYDVLPTKQINMFVGARGAEFEAEGDPLHQASRAVVHAGRQRRASATPSAATGPSRSQFTPPVTTQLDRRVELRRAV